MRFSRRTFLRALAVGLAAATAKVYAPYVPMDPETGTLTRTSWFNVGQNIRVSGSSYGYHDGVYTITDVISGPRHYTLKTIPDAR